MTHADVVDGLVRGAAAGLAGTLALQVMRTISARALPATMPRLLQDPGDFMVQKAEKVLPDAVTGRIPPRIETAAAKAVAAGYGLTAGAAYGVLRPRRRRHPGGWSE